MISSSPTNASLLILQFNANGLQNHLNELQIIVHSKSIDIAIITETHFTNNSYVYIPGYKLINANHPDNTAHRGVAIFIKSSLEFQVLLRFCQDYLQSCALTIKLNFTSFTIAALYSPPKHKITNQKLTDYFNTIQQDDFIMGRLQRKTSILGLSGQ